METIHKKQLEAQKRPPTQGALHEAIARAHFQAMVWHQAHVLHPQLPLATEYGWKTEGGQLVPITTMDPPAPTTVTHLIKCGCKNNCRSHCSCRFQISTALRCVCVEQMKRCVKT